MVHTLHFLPSTSYTNNTPEFSPYSQKVRHVLAGNGIPFRRSDQPVVLPRPILDRLDITYRRIPILAIGKDVYADSARIIEEVQQRHGALAQSPADKAYEVFGAHVFATALHAIPGAVVTPEFKKDRATIFPALLRPDFDELRPSGLAAMRALYRVVEDEFLGASPGPFVGGAEKYALADVHVGWVVQWALRVIGLEKEAGFGREDLPRVYKWIERFPQPRFEDVGQEDVWETVLNAEYSAEEIGVDEGDSLGIKKGTVVSVENVDTTPGAHPQNGKLVGLNGKEVVVELKNGIRLHFPRVGYLVKEAKVGGMGSRFSL
jgi:glutathione S-transferase